VLSRVSLVGAVLALAAGPAAAADLGLVLEAPVPEAASPFTWSGVYFGAQAGYGWGKTEHSFSNGAPSGTSELGGPVGGLYAGYNAQIGSVVIGVEGDIGLDDVVGNFRDDRGITSAGSARLEWDASIRGRFGAAFGRTLAYATGGLAIGGFEFKGGPDSDRVCCGYSDTLTGWTVGAGVEHAITSHLVTRLEYRYTDYGDASGRLEPAFPNVKMRTENTMSTIRAGLGYKF
jgi:outer membrane immunogenic protein